MKAKQLTRVTMLCALAIVFHMIETMVPVPVPIPGFRFGLANIPALIALYLFTPKTMVQINFIRVLFASLLNGTLFGTGFWLSFTGVTLSTCAVCIAYKKRSMSVFGVSVAGSCFHVIGQVLAVTLIYQQFLMQALLPILVALSIPTGLCSGWICKEVWKRIGGAENGNNQI